MQEMTSSQKLHCRKLVIKNQVIILFWSIFFLLLPCLWSLSFPVLQNCTTIPAINMIGINENTTQVYQQCGKSDLLWWPYKLMHKIH